MEEFLIKNYIYITYVIELVAVVAGLICFNRYKKTPATFFIKILIYLFFIELIGSYAFYYDKFEWIKPLRNTIFKSSTWWYTLFFDIGFVVLILLFYKKIIHSTRLKNILKYLTYSYLVFSILYLVLNKDTLFIQNFPLLSVISGIIILIACAFYLLELLLSDKILKFYKYVYFYITIGIFIWWIIITPLTFYDNYMVNGDWNFIVLKWQVYLTINFITYTLFAIGIIVSKPEKST